MTLAERLIELRRSHKLTQRQVYTGIDVAPLVYQRYEYGREPAYKQLMALANYFNVSLDYLTGRTDNPEINR